MQSYKKGYFVGFLMKPEDEKTQTEKLEEDIAELKTRIKNTEYDLTHMFKGNNIIKQKLDNSKKLLVEKETLMKEFSGNKDKNQEFKELKEDIAEKKTIPISAQQEAIIEETIEEELM